MSLFCGCLALKPNEAPNSPGGSPYILSVSLRGGSEEDQHGTCLRRSGPSNNNEKVEDETEGGERDDHGRDRAA